MPQQVLDVVDTAVKVGLGAIISGIATYSISHLNHRTEKNKELAKQRIEVLTFSIENLEMYFSEFSKCYSRLTGLLQGGTLPGDFPPEKLKNYKELDRKLVDARNSRSVAYSRLSLIGEFEAASLVKKISNVEKKFRDKVIFEKQLPSLDELNDLGSQMNEIKKKLYNLLSKAFENAYG